MNNEWRSIDSAPRDGSKILLWHLDNNYTIGYFERGHWVVNEDLEYSVPATHWIRLPEQPIVAE